MYIVLPRQKSRLQPLKKSLHHESADNDSDQAPTAGQRKKSTSRPLRPAPINKPMRHVTPPDPREKDGVQVSTRRISVKSEVHARTTGLGIKHSGSSGMSEPAGMPESSYEPEPNDDSDYLDEPESHDESD